MSICPRTNRNCKWLDPKGGGYNNGNITDYCDNPKIRVLTKQKGKSFIDSNNVPWDRFIPIIDMDKFIKEFI